MFDIRVFTRAVIVGIVLQVALMVLVHVSPYVAQNGFLLGGMMITALAGYFYAMDTGKGYFTSATIAAIIGAVCAMIGVGLSVLLHDARQSVIPFFTTICVITGAVGGIFGQMAANLKRMGY